MRTVKREVKRALRLRRTQKSNGEEFEKSGKGYVSESKKAKGYLIYRSAKKGPLCEADEKAGEEACICG